MILKFCGRPADNHSGWNFYRAEKWAVGDLLGHTSVATTQLYTKVSATRLRAVVDALPD